jgi:hypothetical protein
MGNPVKLDRVSGRAIPERYRHCKANKLLAKPDIQPWGNYSNPCGLQG